ncbi:hypothetical protein ACMD2_19121, partial [Ananas comosus]
RALRLTNMATRRNFRYTPLSPEDRDDGIGSDEREEDLRFAYNPKSLNRIPWKSICLALFLLLLGSLLLLLSYFIFTGHMEGDRSQAYGLLFLGLLSFLPGMALRSTLFYLTYDFMRRALLIIRGGERQDILLLRSP